MTNTKYATGFQVGAINVALEVYGLKQPLVWGVEKPDAVSIAYDCGIVSLVVSVEDVNPRSHLLSRFSTFVPMAVLAAVLVGSSEAAADVVAWVQSVLSDRGPSFR